MKGRIAILVVAAALAAGQAQETLKGRLASVPVEAKTRPDIAGVGTVTAVLAGNKLTVNGTFDQFISPATTAQVHLSKVTGTRGPVIFDLTVTKAMKGTVSGTLDLTPQQADAAKKGQLYVMINTAKAPEGNVWGWLLK